jgi:ribosomal protein S18 acetylase RimI-like enzyme
VTPSQRGKGFGRELLTAAFAKAGEDPLFEQFLLSVGTTQAAAERLYRGLGFEVFGTEPRALKVGSTYVDEHQMILLIAMKQLPYAR